MVTVANLGWCVGKLDMQGEHDSSLTIYSPHDTEPYVPGSDIRIYGRDNIRKLCEFLKEAL